MATEIWKNAFIQLGTVNLSAHVTELSLSYEVESLDETAMGDDSRVHKGGLKNWGVDITMNQDYATGAVDATLHGIVGCQTCIEMRPKNVCSTVINPRFQGTVMVQSAPPFAGSVGSLLMATVRLESAGDLSRNTAAT